MVLWSCFGLITVYKFSLCSCRGRAVVCCYDFSGLTMTFHVASLDRCVVSSFQFSSLVCVFSDFAKKCRF